MKVINLFNKNTGDLATLVRAHISAQEIKPSMAVVGMPDHIIGFGVRRGDIPLSQYEQALIELSDVTEYKHAGKNFNVAHILHNNVAYVSVTTQPTSTLGYHG